MSVFRIYVEKKPEFAVEAQGILNDLKTVLGISGLTSVRVINRYDVEGISQEEFELAKHTIFSEPQVDNTSAELPVLAEDEQLFAIEPLPGQFDQRADSCAQCIQILTHGLRPAVKTAQLYVVKGDVAPAEFVAIKHYVINPVESREASLEPCETLNMKYDVPQDVAVLDGFCELSKEELAEFITRYGLAMDLDDICFCQEYFRDTEHRAPTITEIRMIDTYWSDHCRHTTFATKIDSAQIEDPEIKATYEDYLKVREELGRAEKPLCLMDLATIAAKKLKRDGILVDLDESEEINACSVRIKADVNGEQQDWLLMFKNETHNHPTEIEPFGGAATCLGGAIRDPLSGRSYVYQAMRVTGAADPLAPFDQTIPGKLPQRKIVTTAANGYSSYGNQIGLATGHVSELYHPGYVAKRMEIGAVVGAAPAENVVREVPSPSDVIILLGGKTGRDGCGGATGSSKSHTVQSLESCGAEVQKGNAPEERKLQRLFRNPAVTTMIKRCNDFGAGGVSVAIGELADGLEIDLDAVPKKYEGLDGTELAISESQERMAVVIRAEDTEKFMAEAAKENLLATKVAVVTESPRLKMTWRGKQIVDLSREFLNSNGAEKHTDVTIESGPVSPVNQRSNTEQDWIEHLSDLNVCSQKGLVERFDATIGAGTVLMPYGGKNQLTENQAMAAKLPVLGGETNTASLMAWGFNPHISSQNPYYGAQYAVIESVAKVIAAGGKTEKCWLTFQEYFERTKNDPKRWGKPMSALLGAYKAQLGLGMGAIGGKDSMSGTFEDIDVPPTLTSFAVSVADAREIVSTEFKQAGHKVGLITPTLFSNGAPDYDSVNQVLGTVQKFIEEKKVVSAWALSFGGVAEAVAKMGFGNSLGFAFTTAVNDTLLFNPVYGGFVLELTEECDGVHVIGEITEKPEILCGDVTISLDKLRNAYEQKLEPVFPALIKTKDEAVAPIRFNAETRVSPSIKVAKPRVVIPVFPGTNCEYDTARQFEAAGAQADVFVINNLSSQGIQESVAAFTELVKQAQIIMIPGGFSGGDEPDGSGKFITSFFRNPSIKDEVHNLLKNRDGLMLGICNGFQALVKLGLVPYGEIVEPQEQSPTLTYNTIGRHQSMMVNTRIASNKSPWLAYTEVGEIHRVPISHGEGRFIAPQALLDELIANGQVATQYVDNDGNPTYDIRFNPNTSALAIEGITSKDGRIFGKMAHSERVGSSVCKNVPGCKDQKLFQAGVDYFK